jgi:hypothetical protein
MRNQRNQYPSVVNNFYQQPLAYEFVSYAGVPNSDGATQVNLTDGIPTATFPTITQGVIKPSPASSPTTYLPNISTVTFPQNFDRGYYQTWNVFVQREFSPTLNAQVGYVGTHGIRIDNYVNILRQYQRVRSGHRHRRPAVLSESRHRPQFSGAIRRHDL